MNARRSNPVPSTGDLGFLRTVIQEVQDIRVFRKAEARRIESLRKMIVHRIVSALIRRHRTYSKTRDDVADDLFEWLHGKLLEETYLRHAYATRLRWASRPILAIRDSTELSYKELKEDHWWLFTDIARKLNTTARLQHPYRISVYPSNPREEGYKDVPTMIFVRDPV